MLESRARARSGSVAEAMRSKIVLSLAAGNSQAQTSRTVGCSVNTVRLWKERFVGERLGGLYGRHRGRSRSKESRYSYLARFYSLMSGRMRSKFASILLRSGGAGQTF